MARPFVRTCVRVSCVFALAAWAWLPDGGAAARSASADRHLLLTVLDADGEPMTDLRTEQFVVLEDGELRPVTASRVATEPLSVALMLDMTQPVIGQTLDIRAIRDAASSFIRTLHAAQPDARIQLMEIAGSSTVRMKFSNDTPALLASAGRLFQSQQGDGPVIEAVVEAARDLKSEKTQRRVIISVDRDSSDPSRQRPEDVTRAVQEASASVWAISIREAGRGSAMREEMLGFLTQEFGGTMQTARVLTPLENMLTRMARVLTSQYVITYTRPDGADVTDILAGTTTAGTVLMGELVEG